MVNTPAPTSRGRRGWRKLPADRPAGRDRPRHVRRVAGAHGHHATLGDGARGLAAGGRGRGAGTRVGDPEPQVQPDRVDARPEGAPHGRAPVPTLVGDGHLVRSLEERRPVPRLPAGPAREVDRQGSGRARLARNAPVAASNVPMSIVSDGTGMGNASSSARIRA
jgi:hypothetical protein